MVTSCLPRSPAWANPSLTLTFEDIGGKTKLSLTQTGFPADEAAEMAGIGWNQAFEKLAAAIA